MHSDTELSHDERALSKLRRPFNQQAKITGDTAPIAGLSTIDQENRWLLPDTD